MIETLAIFLYAAMPYILVGLGILGCFLLLARITVSFASSGLRPART